MPVLEVWAETPPDDFPKLRRRHMGTGEHSESAGAREKLVSDDKNFCAVAAKKNDLEIEWP
jgi:hypothetical protein